MANKKQVTWETLIFASDLSFSMPSVAHHQDKKQKEITV